MRETSGQEVEVIVVDDGSTDGTVEVVRKYSCIRLVLQPNKGPAAARNLGSFEAKGQLLLFTDDDCIPAKGWLKAMLAPFGSPEVIGVKGVYRTCQRELIARFVQIEYEDKYRLMSSLSAIDFVDTYSAAFRRDNFLAMGGYDTSFPVACAEDIELSYRMSARGWIMKFAPSAIVFHTHPDTLAIYIRKKYKFAFWRVFAVSKNPAKGVKDSHTPQLMKLQLLFVPLLFAALVADIFARLPISFSYVTAGLFIVTTIPFTQRTIRTDVMVGLLSPILLAARAFAQFFGLATGVVAICTRHRPLQSVLLV